MMRKIALISSYCDTDEKIEKLKSNLNLLKSLEIDTMVLSPIKIDVESDFLFITKENPVFGWPQKSTIVWLEFNSTDKRVVIKNYLNDYGWASLYQFKKLMEISSTFDYDIFYPMMYDLNIDDNIIEDIKSGKTNYLYQRINWRLGNLHFSSFDKEKMKQFSELLTLERYSNHEFAEGMVGEISSLLSLDVSENIASDSIVTDNNVFNFSKTNEYKMFFNNYSFDLESKLKIIFYDFQKSLFVTVNENKFTIESNNSFYLLETDIPFDQLNFLNIETDSSNIDYTNNYLKAKTVSTID